MFDLISVERKQHTKTVTNAHREIASANRQSHTHNLVTFQNPLTWRSVPFFLSLTRIFLADDDVYDNDGGDEEEDEDDELMSKVEIKDIPAH